MFVVWRRTYTARTGVRVFDRPYQCGECGASAHARVATQGHGSASALYGVIGGNATTAQMNAEQAAASLAHAAFVSAACPACGRFNRAMIANVHAAEDARVTKGRRRVPVAAALAGVTLLLGLVGAVADRSGFLALFALGAAAAAAGIGVVAMHPEARQPSISHPPNVAYWWNGSWFVPQASYVPPGAMPPGGSAWVGGVLLGAAVIPSFVGLVAWGMTFQTLWVVDTQRPEEPLVVKIDGVEVGRVEGSAGKNDALARSFTVRSGEHVVEAFTQSGQSLGKQAFTAPRGGSEKMIFAPRARDNGACLLVEETRYGTDKSGPKPTVKSLEGDFSSAAFDDAFVASPESISVDSNSPRTVSRYALRVLDCAASARAEDFVPFSSQEASAASSATPPGASGASAAPGVSAKPPKAAKPPSHARATSPGSSVGH